MALRNARYRLCAHGGVCVQTEGLYSRTYALQIGIAAGYGSRQSLWLCLATTKIGGCGAQSHPWMKRLPKGEACSV